MNKITASLFNRDIREDRFNNDFKDIFGIEIVELLEDYDYDEIDEFPFEIENRGIMIGFSAETIKVAPQIEYIDLEIIDHADNINYLTKTIPRKLDSSNQKSIEAYLVPFQYLKIYYSLYNISKVDRIIFHDGDLRYELSVNNNLQIYRIRVCFNEDISSINMRTYYPFEG